MLRSPTYFLPTRLTPAPGPGLRLAASPASGWLFGALTVDDAEPSQAVHEAWGRALMIHLYANEEPGVRSRGLVGPRALASNPLPARTAGGALTLPFAVDLHELFGPELAGGWYAFATAREHASPALHLTLRAFDAAQADEAAVLGPGGPPTPAEAVVLARASLRAGAWERADALLTAALADEAIKADLNAGAAYDGACAATRASAQADGPARHTAGGRALGLLRDDVHLGQKALAAALQRRVLGALDASAPDARFTSLVDQEVEHLRWARHDDPDLAPLRASLAFAGIFRAEPRARAATVRR